MKRVIIFIFFNIMLFANENIYLDAKVLIKMVEKDDIQFIATENMKKYIRGSKIIQTNTLFSSNILGEMECTPLYACPNKIKEVFSHLNIQDNQPLILYDNSYGVYASTLYTILESLGYKNITILNGGVEAISSLDPNQKLYDKYSSKLNKLLTINKDLNTSENSIEIQSKINTIRKKLTILKPYLLVEKKVVKPEKIGENTYTLGKTNISYLLSKNDLKKAVESVRNHDNNITIIDSCPMIDIVGNAYGSYVAGVKSISWKNLIDKKENRLKSMDELKTIFNKLDKHQEYNLYCMSNSNKALFMMTVMRYLGYNKVKAFTGDWSVWTGDENE